MIKVKLENARLPRNFHKTFIPERRYIHAMLQFASTGKDGDYQYIASETGIPTGASSGKAPAILDYCRGMGLVILTNQARSAAKSPRLTPFGRVVLLEDPYLKEVVTQWVAHLNLCGPLTGADVWHQVFFRGTQTLGNSFQRASLEEYLRNVYAAQNGKLIGPLVRMYEDPSSFASCGALNESGNMIKRISPPVIDKYAWGYGAWIVDGINRFFPSVDQITVTELDRCAGWRTIPGWSIDEFQQVLGLIERKEIIKVDRHMNPWILQRGKKAQDLWARVYDDLL
jgi:hypothetical protein